MSGDSLPFPLPLSGFATDSCEASTLYRELRKPLLQYLVCLGLSADEAQDMVQDAFLSLHRHLASGGSQANIRSWLFRVAHNGARNRQQSYDRRFGKPLDPDLDSISDEATPEQVVLEKEKVRRLGKAILLLTEYELRCGDGGKDKSPTEILGAPPGERSGGGRAAPSVAVHHRQTDARPPANR